MAHVENLKNYIRLTSKKKEAIRKKRANGLKKLDIALEKVDMQTILDKAIQLYHQNRTNDYNKMTPYFFSTYGWNDWSYFHYDCFLNVVRDILESINKKYIETSISFNLDEALTPSELDYVAKNCNISLSAYDDTYPRDFKTVQLSLGRSGLQRESGFPHAHTNG